MKDSKKKQLAQTSKITEKMRLVQAVLHCKLYDLLARYAGQAPSKQVLAVEIIDKAYAFISKQKATKKKVVKKKDLRLEDILSKQQDYELITAFSDTAKQFFVQVLEKTGMPKKYYAPFTKTKK